MINDACALNLISLFEQNGHKAYAVGGCVRDSLLSRPVSDVDIAVSCTPDITESVLTKGGFRYAETGLKHGTVTAITDFGTYEITTFRTDGDYLDNRRPDNVCFVTDIKDDLARRDFTVNAMAYNPTDGLVDIFGGKKDLDDKLIRAVGNAGTRFDEDALRILRALRFSSVLGFDIECQTSHALREKKHLLCNIARERISVELKKLLCGTDATRVVFDFRDVLETVLPVLSNISEKHAWKIACATLDNTPKDYVLRLAVLFFYALDEIDEKSKISALNFAVNSLKLSSYDSKLVRFLVKNAKINVTCDRVSLKKQMFAYGADNMEKLVRFKCALSDTADATLVVFNDIIANAEPTSISELAVNGNDMMSLGCKGKDIADALSKILHRVMDGTLKNDKTAIMDYMSVTVRPATVSDFERICEIYKIARESMKRNGNPTQWRDNYPPTDLVLRDIKDGISYVCEKEGLVRAVFILSSGDDPTYRVIENGDWLNNRSYIALHRVASDGTVRGVFSVMADYFTSVSDNIRGDTHDDNIPMQRVLEKNGFVRCGTIYADDGTKRIAYHYSK